MSRLRTGRLPLRLEALEDRTLPATITWINTQGGSWNVTSNWDLNRLPAAGDDVVIPALGSGVAVTHASGSDTVQSVTSGGNMVLSNSSTLKVNGNLQVSSGRALTLDRCTLANATVTGGSLLVFTGTTIAGIGSTLMNVTVNGDMDLSQQPNTRVTVYGGLVLNGTMSVGKADGSTYGLVYFADGGSLTGHATVVFGGAALSSNVLENDGATFTIGPEVTIRGKNGAIYSKNTNGSLVNQGTISIDVAGGTFNVGGGGAGNLGNPNDGSDAFTNQGTINVSNGATLGLYGKLTLAGLGTINSRGAAVILAGTLDLGGGTLMLNANSGSWTLLAGTIKNGTLNESEGALLSIPTTSNGGVLTNMTVNGDLDLSQQQNVYIRVYGGLTLNGTLYLGRADGSTYGSIWFADSNTPAGSLTGNATVVFGGAGPGVTNHVTYFSNLPGAAGTLTIGPAVTIRGKNGTVSGNLFNQGTITANTAGGTINLGFSNGTITNTGTLSAQNGGTLSIQGVLMLSGPGILSEAITSAIVFTGNLLATITNPAQFTPQGKVTLTGTSTAAPQLLEAMSRDVGINSTAYSQNYAYGTLALAYNPYAPNYVQLVDQAHNSSGSGPEAVYTSFLIVPAGTTLDLGGLHLYARSTQISGTILNGTITLIPDSGPLPLGVPTPGMVSAVGEVDDWTFFGTTGNAATITVNPGSSGTPAPFAPQLNWAQVQLLDFKNNVLASASNASGGTSLLTLANVALPADGVYTIRISAPPGQHASSTGNYVVLASIGRTATATTVSPSVSASTYGQAVTFTATVTSGNSPVGEGTVTFREGNTILAGPVAVDVTGHANFTTSLLTVAGSPHIITATYSGSLSYDTSVGTTSFTVNKAHLTVTASNPSRLYGDANPPFAATITGFKNGETLAASGVTGSPSLTTTATLTSPVGYYTVSAALGSLAAANYDFVFVNGTLAVYPAHLIVMADNASRPYGTANPIFTATFTGFKNGETLATSGVSGSPSLTTTATAASPPGSYVIRATLGSLTASNYDFSFMNGTLTVTSAPLSATGVALTATASAPYRGVVASFANADPFGDPSSYTATITWGDGSTSTGFITDNGDGTFSVSGSHTFADPASDTVQVLIQHRLGYTTSATTTATATVTSLDLGIEAGQSARAASWRSDAGLELIRSFNGGASSAALASWLAATFPNLYGTNAGAHNLTGKTNADVAAFFVSLFDQPDSQLDAEVLATALNVYATTLTLGGTLGQSYGFAVSDTGLGARSYNVGPDGAAFGVANAATLNVYQLLLAVNSRAVHGMLYDGDEGLRQMAYEVFTGINQAGGL